MTDEDILPGFREALVHAASQQASRRARSKNRLHRVSVAFAAIIAIAIVGSGLLVVGSGRTADADVIVSRGEDSWQIRVTSDNATAERVEDVLADAGIAARIETVPVGPSRVGEFLSGDGNVRVIGDDPRSSRTVQVPADVSSVHILFGREAENHEKYDVFSSAFAEGEPLECSGLLGRSAGDALPAIRTMVDRVDVLDPEGNAVEAAPDSRLVIGRAIMLSAEHALVSVVPATTERIGPGDGSRRCPVG